MQDVLRVIGLGLEVSNAPQVTLRIDAAGILVVAQGTYGRRIFLWDDLASQARGLQAGRRRPRRRLVLPSTDPWALTRWSVLLRGTGALLDLDNCTTCEIHAAVESVEPPPRRSAPGVRGRAGGARRGRGPGMPAAVSRAAGERPA